MTIYVRDTPKRLEMYADKTVEALSIELPWLENIYGLADTKLRKADKKAVKYPAYRNTDSSDYIDLSPNDKLVNYCFMYANGPDKVDAKAMRLYTEANWVFFLDLKKIGKREEEVVSDIEKFFTDNSRRFSAFTLENIYRLGSQVVKDFDITEIDYQFNKFPYFAVRVSGSLKVKMVNGNCS